MGENLLGGSSGPHAGAQTNDVGPTPSLYSEKSTRHVKSVNCRVVGFACLCIVVFHYDVCVLLYATVYNHRLVFVFIN